ncbi:MAG: hypothetical protein OEM42_07060, partial [Deltaproteobacteria bacterium]|nr:hypothetical protein [Deltaproteobacteria bacterium]
MGNPTTLEKGGSNAAFFFFYLLFAVGVLGLGGSLQYPLAVLRVGGGGAALWYLWEKRREAAPVSPYFLLVGGFVLLSVGHSFSSVYFWVSFQHALNIALAALLFAWAVLLFRKVPGKMWDAAFLAITALALLEVGIALFQHFQGGDPRPRGTFDNANYLAEYLTASSILCCSRFLWSGGSRRFRFAVATGGILFLAAAMFLALSRGVLLASVPAFGILFITRFGFRKGVALL